MEKFLKPEMEVVVFDKEDIISTSCPDNTVGGYTPDMGCDDSLGDPEF